MARYAGYTLADVEDALRSGQPASLHDGGQAIATIRDNLLGLERDLPREVRAVTQDSTAWIGPSADAFVHVVDRLVTFVGAVADALTPYEAQLDTGSDALTTAQGDLATLVAQAEEYRTRAAVAGLVPDETAINAEAQRILTALGDAYLAIIRALTPVPPTPKAAKDLAGEGSPADPASTSFVPTKLTSFTGSLPGLSTFTGHLPPVGTFTGDLPPITVPGGVLDETPVLLTGSGPGFATPATHLTARRIPGLGSEPPAEPVAAGPGRMPPAYLRGALGRRDDAEEEQAQERETVLVGDEDWVGSGGLSEAIGRTPPAAR